MEITPGRAMYSPDEELKPLRQPKTYHPELAAAPSTLSINAVEFVPRFANNPNNVQERLHKHQKQYLQQNYQQYQQPQQQTQQHQQYQQQQQQQHQSHTYSNGYGSQQQHHHQQYQQQPTQSLNTQMGSMQISVQDRLVRNYPGTNIGNRANDGGRFFSQQQQQHHQRGNGGQQQQDYAQNHHYRYNKNHNNHHQHQHQHQQHHNQHQNPYNNQHERQQFQQENQQQQQQQQQSSTASALAESANDMETIALDYLQTVIQCLNQNPGQFDSIATRFNYIFEGMENNHYVLSIAMEDIFDESIRNSNFRYMGAKLYSLLHTLNPNNDSLFHTMLKYKLDFHQQEVRDYMQNKQEACVRETALFLAELYMQLRGEGTRNNLIAENIVFSLKELLSIEDNKDNIRCICLTLKLAGYDLSTDCPHAMRDIITKLDAINCQNPGKYPLANNVIALQRNNWGRKTTQAEAYTPKQIQPLRDSDDPVFYGPDGHEITAEECEFLTNGAAATANSSENEEETDDVDLDPEMDEETERDFKLFLKQANNKT